MSSRLIMSSFCHFWALGVCSTRPRSGCWKVTKLGGDWTCYTSLAHVEGSKIVVRHHDRPAMSSPRCVLSAGVHHHESPTKFMYQSHGGLAHMKVDLDLRPCLCGCNFRNLAGLYLFST
ncbi:hypothetical protein QR685DRAFT_180726 [Neurospora intermedia]|uniref:Secreted protein n=1 Tax=Neurospora intermedia TaxID=5142 RepID=A0ABR3DLU0_NEUIN